jgi:hypothetical protein
MNLLSSCIKIQFFSSQRMAKMILIAVIGRSAGNAQAPPLKHQTGSLALLIPHDR